LLELGFHEISHPTKIGFLCCLPTLRTVPTAAGFLHPEMLPASMPMAAASFFTIDSFSIGGHGVKNSRQLGDVGVCIEGRKVQSIEQVQYFCVHRIDVDSFILKAFDFITNFLYAGLDFL
jgi:hypothetical protein